MKRRFYVLRLVVFLFKIVAFLLLFVGLLSLVFALVQLGSAVGKDGGWKAWTQVGVGIVGFVWAVGEFMVLYALGEGLNVLMAIEENTRATALRMTRLLAFVPTEGIEPPASAEATSSEPS